MVEHETASVLVEQKKINDTSPAPAGMIDSSVGFTPMGICDGIEDGKNSKVQEYVGSKVGPVGDSKRRSKALKEGSALWETDYYELLKTAYSSYMLPTGTRGPG